MKPPERARQQFRGLGWTLGLTVDEDTLELSGRVRGARVRIVPLWSEIPRGGAPDVLVHRVTVTAAVDGFGIPGLTIRPEGLRDLVRVALGGAQDIQLGDPELDPWLHVRAADRALAANALRGSRVIESLRFCQVHGVALFAADGALRLVCEGGAALLRLDRVIDAVTGAAEALREAHDAVLGRLAREVDGLEIDVRGVEGTVGGVPLRVRPIAGTRLRYEIAAPLPAGFPFEVASAASGAGLRLGDPILDATLNVHGADPDAARALFGRDAVRGPLLAIVHGRDGHLGPGGVRVEVDRALPELLDAVRDVADLVVALSAG